MGDVAVRNPTTGELRMVAEADASAFVDQTGWHVADEAQRLRGAKIIESGGLAQQSLAAGETAVRTASLGLVPGLAKGWQQRAEVQGEEHPYIQGAATAIGALAPALATGGAAGALGGAVGLGARGTALLAAGAEGLAGGAAQEIEEARQQTRDVSAGNIFLYGLGGEIVGRALPGALKMGAGKIRRAVSAVEEVAGEGVPSALAGAEARSVETEARIARDLPQGPERQAALDRTAKQQYERLSEDGAKTLEEFQAKAREMSAPSGRTNERLRQAISGESPVQENFFTEQKRALADEYLGLGSPKRAPEPVVAPTAPVAPAAPASDAAAEYALDAARRRLRGVADHTGNPELDALAGKIGERSEAAKGLPDDVKRAINERTGKAKLEEVTAWAKDPEALRAGHGFEAPATPAATPAAAPAATAPPASAAEVDFGAYGKDVRNAIRPGLRKMDKATAAADQYLALREMGQQLEEVSGRIARDKSLEPAVQAQMQAALETSYGRIRSGLRDESLFGGAARIERDLASGAERSSAALSEVNGLNRPKAMRRFLETERTERGAISQHLDDALDGAEESLRAHEAHGTWDPKEIAQQRTRIQQLRESRAVADEIQLARGKGAEPAPASVVAPKGKGGLDWKDAADFAAENVAELFPYGGKIYRLGKRVVAMDRAGRMATRQTARRLAGVGADVAAVAGQAAEAPASSTLRRVAGAVRTVAEESSPGFKKAMGILERRRGQEGAVVIQGEATAKIDKLATKLRDKLERYQSLEANAPASRADDLGVDAVAERHAEAKGRALDSVGEALHELQGEYQSRMSDLTGGGYTEPEKLGPKARAKYERLKAGSEELQAVVEKHSQKLDDAAGEYLDTNTAAASAEYLAGRRKVDTEAGFTARGQGIAGILKSPIGIVTGTGAVGLGGYKAVTALDRFTGDYSGPEESFEAKKQLLDAEQVSPMALYETIGASLEDLPKMNPGLFQQIAARTAENVRYIRKNLPPGIQTTMMYPNGTPPSMSALRDFATIYNTTFDPHSVLEDIEAGTANALQMKTLREAHEDIYEQLRADTVEEIGKNFRSVPLSTKLQLDILFDADGLAGPFFSTKAAGMIAQSMKEDAKRGPSGKATDMPLDELSTGSSPGGISAIQSSVTNRGGGA